MKKVNLVERLGGKKVINEHIVSCLSWLKESFSINNNLGSCMYQSISGRWSGPYPETTGYILPTLLNASKHLKDKELFNLAVSQVEYFSKLQQPSGAFLSKPQSGDIFFFDVSQITLGLVLLAKHMKSDRCDEMILKSYNWMIQQINDSGAIVKHNYHKDYSPSYYSRSVWSLLETERYLSIPYSNITYKAYENILTLWKNNYSFDKCSFHGKPRALTHNIAYSLRGLWESSQLLNDEVVQHKLFDAILFINQNLLLKEGKLYGAYDSSWQADKSFICSAGNAQVAVLFLKVAGNSRPVKPLGSIPLLISPLMRSHRFYEKWTGIKAVPASIPIWGKYQRFRFTNWTQKFYLDALLEILKNHS